ncbi:MAG TPA: BadF/BadG/BcrA/BcrD ATPase family protein [Actinomycetota bacterium]
MGPVLGVEGGGSHAHAIVAETSGRCLGVGTSHDSANWEDVGIEAAAGSIRVCVREAFDAAGLEPEAIAASVFALAGVDFPVDEQRLGGIPIAFGLSEPSRVMNDAFAALRVGSDRPFGVVVIAGTGSVVAGRDPEGREFRTLGLGPVFGDFGGASEVSDAAVTAVAEAFTGFGPGTALERLLPEAAGAASMVDFIEAAGRGRIDPSSFAPQVSRAAADGDAVACGILTRAGEALGANAAHVVRMLKMERLEFDLVLAGGLFRTGTPFLVDALDAVVRPVAPNAVTVLLEDPPVVGAALLAMELAGTPPDPPVRLELARATRSALGLA